MRNYIYIYLALRFNQYGGFNPKVVKELGAGADGYATGGVTIPMTSGTKAEVVTVKGTKALRADKKPVKATWY